MPNEAGGLLPTYGLSEEQLAFRDMLRRFLADRTPMSVVRERMEAGSGVDRAVWREACETLGLAGLAIPESAGGQGFGHAELAVALAELGAALAPLPLFGVAGLLAPVIAHSVPDPARSLHLARLAQGEIAALAWLEPGIGASLLDEERVQLQTKVDEQGRLDGEKVCVLHGEEAERFYVLARTAMPPDQRTEEGKSWALVVVDAAAPGVAVEAAESLDLTRPLARVRFEEARGEVLASGPALFADFSSALETASILLAAEISGAMEKVLESAVSFAATRYQFSRPIGSFQAIKHKAADLLVDFESVRTAVHAALDARDAEDPEWPELAKVAMGFAGPAFVRSATENLQIHGGVGYTWEYDAHLFYRRAHSVNGLLGDAATRCMALTDGLAERALSETEAGDRS